jgi:hypothetical protein
MNSKIGVVFAALLAGASLSLPPAPVHAQSVQAQTVQAQSPDAPKQTAPDQMAKPIKLSDDKLEAAAAAVKRVAAISDKYQQQLAQAPEEKKEGMVREANDAMTKAVTDQGLSVEEFSMIMEVAKNDPSVREKIVKRIK